ncbi:hypothetical protein DRW03_08000 [Corallococcus sp. H22C18031201]|uniref:hypothetical protein n=1 Tax=Citreicoccus inhibens TaxID=2849499 RepID=UPI000E7547A5|nr:hypothetical protein [Citreicoccus inhibens]MBU8900391.1 hypothetical protein [Citreicoccus inhibens]RJS25056.1 hypothetical protein DRW03_08000 [Corallococcus sp. H22C18031201]
MRSTSVVAVIVAGLAMGGMLACGDSKAQGETPDSGTPGSEVDSGTPQQSAGCPANAILCEDFEKGQNGWKEPDEKQHATIAVDGTRVHGGKGALHVTTEDNLHEDSPDHPQAIAHYRKDMPAFGTTLYTRAWVYLARVPQEGVMGTFFILFSPKDNDWGGIELQAMKNGGFALDDWSGVLGTGWNLEDPAVVVMQAGRWTCLEWGVSRARPTDTTGHAQVWVDGTQAFDFPNVGMRPFSNFAVGWGFVHPHGDSDSETWIDDLAVAPTRIGCN